MGQGPPPGKACHSSMVSDQSTGSQQLMLQLAAGQVAFFATLVMTQRLQLLLRVTTATHVLPSLLGAAAVAGASVVSLRTSEAVGASSTTPLGRRPELAIGVVGASLFFLMGALAAHPSTSRVIATWSP